MKIIYTPMLKVISLNVQEGKRLHTALPFLKAQDADVIMLQEILLKDLDTYKSKLNMPFVFTPIADVIFADGIQRLGQAIYSRYPIVNHNADYYVGSIDKIPQLTVQEPEKTIRAILSADVLKDNKLYTCVTTHFTWTPNTEITPTQEKDLAKMFSCLDKIPEFIFAGDFNSPRGRRIFDALASRYKDNIPSDVTTTIDKNLHKAGDLQIVIDGLFTTPEYKVHEVKLHDGVSDHLAVSATIEKV